MQNAELLKYQRLSKTGLKDLNKYGYFMRLGQKTCGISTRLVFETLVLLAHGFGFLLQLKR
jgi:hypothetical protein